MTSGNNFSAFQAELERVLSSRDFQRTPALTRLLSYLGEQALAAQAEGLKEVAIGHALYDRPADYDPKLDSVVRVNANRLRIRLEDHYRSHPERTQRLFLPKWSYALQLEQMPGATTANAAPRKVQESEPAKPGDGEAEQLPLWILRQPTARGRMLYISASVLGLLLSIVVWVAVLRPKAFPAAETFWSVRPFARLGGSQEFGAFSPDGKTLAFTTVSNNGTDRAIYVQAVGSDRARRLAPGIRPEWSPDGTRIAFLRPELAGKKQIIIYSLATGQESVVTELEGGWPWLCALPRLSWSPDGKTLFTSASGDGREVCAVVAVDISSGHVHRLMTSSGVDGDLEAAVSPNGKSVAFLRNQGFRNLDIFLVSAQGGEPRRVTLDHADFVGLTWTPDGKSFIAASNRLDGPRKLWRIPVDGGPSTAFTDGSTEPSFPTVDAHEQQISFTQFHLAAPVWRAEGGKQTLILDNQSFNQSPTLSPDGRELLYTSNRSGRVELWVSHADGSESRSFLPAHAYESGQGRWSPDGLRVVFECRQSGPTHLCVASKEGSEFRQLTHGGASEILPSWSRDGKSIYYTSNASGRPEIYRMRFDTGDVIAVTRGGGYRAVESWDGQVLYVARAEPAGGVVMLPVHGSERDWHEAEGRPVLPEFGVTTTTDWDACPEGLLFHSARGTKASPELSVFNVRAHTTRPAYILSELPKNSELNVSVAPNGRSIIYSAERSQSEVDMMLATTASSSAKVASLR